MCYNFTNFIKENYVTEHDLMIIYVYPVQVKNVDIELFSIFSI